MKKEVFVITKLHTIHRNYYSLTISNYCGLTLYFFRNVANLKKSSKTAKKKEN